MKGKYKRKKLPKFNGGLTPEQIAKQQALAATTNTMGGIASMTGAIGTALGAVSDDPLSGVSKTGNVLSSAGQMASAGAALGPWGIAGGAVLGAGFGLIQNNKMQKEHDKKVSIQSANRNVSANMAVNNMMQANYDMQNFENDRIAGLNKGVAKFKGNSRLPGRPNAMLAPEEIVKDSQTGMLSEVPGRYNKNNPDTVPANIAEGSSVYQKSKRYTLPGGKSTPADIMKRAEIHQKNAYKLLDRKTGLSMLDRKTADANLRAIERLSENLNMNTIMENESGLNGLKMPKYNKGTANSDGNEIYPNTPHEVPVDTNRTNSGAPAEMKRRFIHRPTTTITYMKDGKRIIADGEIKDVFKEDWDKLSDASSDERRNIAIMEKYKIRPSDIRWSNGYIEFYNDEGSDGTEAKEPSVAPSRIGTEVTAAEPKPTTTQPEGSSAQQPAPQSQNPVKPAAQPQQAAAQPQTDSTATQPTAKSYYDLVGRILEKDWRDKYMAQGDYVYDKGNLSLYKRTNEKAAFVGLDSMFDRDGNKLNPGGKPQAELTRAGNNSEEGIYTSNWNLPHQGNIIGLDHYDESRVFRGTKATADDFRYVAENGANSEFGVTLGDDGKTWVKYAKTNNGPKAEANPASSEKPEIRPDLEAARAKIDPLHVTSTIKKLDGAGLGKLPKPTETPKGDHSSDFDWDEYGREDDVEDPVAVNANTTTTAATTTAAGNGAGNAAGNGAGNGAQEYFDNLSRRNSILNAVTDLAAMAPIAYNLFNSTPEVFSPMHGSYLNPNQRYNIAPRVASSLKQRQIARFNQSAAGAGSGASMAQGSNLYAKSIEDKGNILDTASKFNADMRERYAGRHNENVDKVIHENRRVEDLNSRSRAAARNMKATAMNQISSYAQNKQLMRNQAISDVHNSKVWEAIASSVHPEEKERLMQMMNSITSAPLGIPRQTKSNTTSKAKEKSKRNGGPR